MSCDCRVGQLKATLTCTLARRSLLVRDGAKGPALILKIVPNYFAENIAAASICAETTWVPKTDLKKCPPAQTALVAIEEILLGTFVSAKRISALDLPSATVVVGLYSESTKAKMGPGSAPVGHGLPLVELPYACTSMQPCRHQMIAPKRLAKALATAQHSGWRVSAVQSVSVSTGRLTYSLAPLRWSDKEFHIRNRAHSRVAKIQKTYWDRGQHVIATKCVTHRRRRSLVAMASYR